MKWRRLLQEGLDGGVQVSLLRPSSSLSRRRWHRCRGCPPPAAAAPPPRRPLLHFPHRVRRLPLPRRSEPQPLRGSTWTPAPSYAHPLPRTPPPTAPHGAAACNLWQRNPNPQLNEDSACLTSAMQFAKRCSAGRYPQLLQFPSYFSYPKAEPCQCKIFQVVQLAVLADCSVANWCAYVAPIDLTEWMALHFASMLMNAFCYDHCCLLYPLLLLHVSDLKTWDLSSVILSYVPV
jgi:hypothetical protein